MIIPRLALKSLLNRKTTVFLTVMSIAISVLLLLGVERIRHQTKENFLSTVSGTDLIVGARGSSVNLLLYSVFRIGNAANNISWESFKKISNHPAIEWAVPISLGDSHKGFRVLGTNNRYFEYYQYGDHEPLAFIAGTVFDEHDLEVVLGADVASQLGYSVGDQIVLAHGMGEVSFSHHDAHPFTVSGILHKTGTPIDRTLHVSLESIEIIHGTEEKLHETHKDEHTAHHQHTEPGTITAAFFGLKNKTAALHMQRIINEFRGEPLTATIPGLALQELWNLIGTAETALRIISAFVVITGLVGMLSAILTTLNERRREMAILRSVGAKTTHIFILLVSEATILATAGVTAGIGLLYAGLWISRGWVEQEYGIHLAMTAMNTYEWSIAGIIIAAGFLFGAIPAWRAYRNSLADGMMIRM